MNLCFPKSDWQDASHYDALSNLDRAGLAWEFVRRDPRYASLVAALAVEAHPVQRGVEIIPPDEALADFWGLSFR